jgi:response regulator RpfG family c-di-GMP phosphodiesterase
MSSVLIVDSDGKSLASIQRKLRRRFETRIALGAPLGLQYLREEGPFAVVIAEFSMEDMDGIVFLNHVRKIFPYTTRILISRKPMEVMDLLRVINDGKVYHLLSASCDDSTLLDLVEEGVARYGTIEASTQNVHQIQSVYAKLVHDIVCWLRSDVRDMLSPILPVLRALCLRLGDTSPMVTEIACQMSIIGMICLPDGIVDKVVNGQQLSDEEHLIFAGHPEHAVDLFRYMPQLNEVSETLRGYSNFLHTAILPKQDVRLPEMPLGSLLLALVIQYRLELYQSKSAHESVERLRSEGRHNPEHLRILEDEIARLNPVEQAVTLDDLRPGMVLTQPVRGLREGKEVMLAPEGYELSRTTIIFLRQSARHGTVREPIMVRARTIRPEDSGSV